MQFEQNYLNGVWQIQLEPFFDSRGFFVRTFSVDEFVAHGLETKFPQHSVSFSSYKGTVRGMHFQREPHSEVKLVRCIRGVIWDVIIDLNPESPTFLQWQGFELSDKNARQLYVPKGFAHGFQTLCDNVEVNYLISECHAPEAASGVRYDDPCFGITWPLPVTAISERDSHWPAFTSRDDLLRTQTV